MGHNPEHISGLLVTGRNEFAMFGVNPIQHPGPGLGEAHVKGRSGSFMKDLVSEDAVGLRCVLSRSALLSSSAERSASVASSRPGSATLGLDYGSSS